AQCQDCVDRGMVRRHGRIWLDGYARRFPDLAQLPYDLAGIGIVSLAESGQKAAIFALEDALDAGIAARRECGGVEPVARGKSVVHALDHGLELRRHEPAGLGARDTQRILELA